MTPETGQVACKIEMPSPVLKELAEQVLSWLLNSYNSLTARLTFA